MSSHSLKILILAWYLAASATGCVTRVIAPPNEPYSGYPVVQKRDLVLGLKLEPQFCVAEWRYDQKFGDLWLMPVGDNLCANARALAGHLFVRVVELATESESPGPDVDLLLVPRLALINRTWGATGWGESITTLKVEWRFVDLEGRTIWADAVGGEARGKNWSRKEGMLADAIADLMAKSHDAIVESRELTRFAATIRH